MEVSILDLKSIFKRHAYLLFLDERYTNLLILDERKRSSLPECHPNQRPR